MQGFAVVRVEVILLLLQRAVGFVPLSLNLHHAASARQTAMGLQLERESFQMGNYSENAMASQMEQIEAKYRQLQAKTMQLEAMHKELEQKIHSLETARLLAHNVIIPNDPANTEWLQQHRKKDNGWRRPEPKRKFQKVRLHRGPGGRNMVSGPEVADERHEQQRRKNDDWRRRQEKKSSKVLFNQSRSDAQMVSGPEARRVNDEWLEQQQRKNDDWIRRHEKKSSNVPFNQSRSDAHMVSGPEAQRFNDEWRRQQKREQERFTSVKRVRDEEPKQANGALFVGGIHAKKINDEWLQQTGNNVYKEESNILNIAIDATVVERNDPEFKRTMTPDQDKSSHDALRINDDGPVSPQRRLGRNLDIQDATLIDPKEDEKGAFIQSQLEEVQETKDYFEDDPKPESPQGEEPQPESTAPDINQHVSNQKAEESQTDRHQQANTQKAAYQRDKDEYEQDAERGEFNDGWDKAGRSPDQNGEFGCDRYEKETRLVNEVNNKGPQLNGLQPDPDLHVPDINPDQGEALWGRRLL